MKGSKNNGELKSQVCLDTELVPMHSSRVTEEMRGKLHLMPTSTTVTQCLERETATAQQAVSTKRQQIQRQSKKVPGTPAHLLQTLHGSYRFGTVSAKIRAATKEHGCSR